MVNADTWENYIFDLDELGFGGGTIKVRFLSELDGVFNTCF